MAQADSVPTPNHARNPARNAQQSTTPRRIRIKPADRRYFVGGSDARIIMGDDETALIRLWREKRGEFEPEDLSGNLVVQLGVSTEDLNRRWYESNTGQVLTDIQRHIRHPALRWMAATLDGRVEATGAVFESKFMLPWAFSEEAAAEKYMPQLQHMRLATDVSLTRGCEPRRLDRYQFCPTTRLHRRSDAARGDVRGKEVP